MIASAGAAEPTKRETTTQVAAWIDALLLNAASKERVTPAVLTSDASFLRRLTLDLNGQIPSATAVQTFLADKNPDKRRQAIAERLADPRYVRHLTHQWRDLLLAQANPQDMRYLAPKIETWLAEQLRADVPYDAWVRALLTTPLDARPTTALDRAEDLSAHALAFFQANELKPENLAAATARVFLGVNLDCAQCHNHPFADWKQQQFWQFAAFYAGVQRLRPDNAFMPAPEAFERRSLTITGTERIVQATFLDGRAPTWAQQDQPRAALATWLISAENPYFARAAVNRLWAHLFGRGLVEPLDGLGGRDAPSHPELLDGLARRFIAHDFDWKFMLAAIAETQAYQRSSRVTHDSQRDAPHFARQRVRGLTAEQVYDSLVLATGYREPANSPSAAKIPSPRAELITRFSSLDRPTDTPTSISQALSLMNGRFVTDALDLETSGTLAAIIDAPFLDRAGRIEMLYLTTLSRQPTAEETHRSASFVAAASDERLAYADLFWALLNSGEFILNH